MGKVTPEEHFWSYLQVAGPDDCWLWSGCKVNGYGIIRIEGKNISCHRFSWTIHNGPIPEGLCVLHRCDVKNCENPTHLFLGTVADNNADKTSKNRQALGEVHSKAMKSRPKDIYQRGEKHHQAKLREADVKEIMKALSRGCTYASLAREYNVGWHAIARIDNGERWAHITKRRKA